jgi:hypothetical protein
MENSDYQEWIERNNIREMNAQILVALERLVSAIERSPRPTPFDGIASEARAAIAKARGEA